MGSGIDRDLWQEVFLLAGMLLDPVFRKECTSKITKEDFIFPDAAHMFERIKDATPEDVNDMRNYLSATAGIKSGDDPVRKRLLESFLEASVRKKKFMVMADGLGDVLAEMTRSKRKW